MTRTLLLIPLDDVVVFPTMDVTLPVDPGEEERVLLVPRTDGEFASVGTIARVKRRVRLPGGAHGAVFEGEARGVAGAAQTDAGGDLRVVVEERPDDVPVDGRTRELTRTLRATIEEILQLRGDDGSVATILRAIKDPGALADALGYDPELTTEQKIELLSTLDVTERLERATELIGERLSDLQLRRKIRDDVESGAQKQQREYLLRKQMDSIRQELGEDEGSVVDEYRAKIEDAGMPAAVREQAEKELARFERMGGEGSGEAQMIRNYLDWLLAVPWGERSEENLDPTHARDVLDADHHGLDDVKDRIVEFLAVKKLRRDRGIDPVAADEGPGATARPGTTDDVADGSDGTGSDDDPASDPTARPTTGRRRTGGTILTLVGPPGTGKTSIGESVARATGREFVRIALGGVRDESEIRGHRRTYIGALPGRLVRALRDAGTMNPVVLLDEVDKIGADWRGDPSAALLEVLDPAQNHSFRDHYLDVELDLSQVLFLATANSLDTIPAPLLDRMEVIPFDGYTVMEKTAIARDHLVPRQRDVNGLRDDEVRFADGILRTVVDEYTREAGVRQLDRQIGTLLRKTATRIASGRATAPVTIDLDVVRDALGRQKVFHESAARTAVPGVATGLAVTGAGGDVLFVEATRVPVPGSKGTLQLTGQLGDVMKESARIALSWVRANHERLGIDPAKFVDAEFHVHVPAGAIPKDGPSAGITMVTALVSLLTGRPVKHTVGMTGEVTLQGRVLPIGGLKQKSLAAHAAGLTDIVISERNRGDIDDVPEEVRDAVTFHPTMHLGEVLEIALEERVAEVPQVA
ncbi:MAG: endopeptidase La [Solirubrobacteraceae bacterium]|nr:endopeptidase La [Solirubrobacteraceae bacterium]